MAHKPQFDRDADPHTVWEEIYKSRDRASSGIPGKLLVQFAGPLQPGRALELGCARGDDAIWLAKQGFEVTAIDISETVLGYAKDNAEKAGVRDAISFEQHDLAKSFPEGAFDFVLASYLQSPIDWPREKVLARAADAVAPGGHILIIEHGSAAPWMWADSDTHFPRAEDTLSALALDPALWVKKCVSSLQREAKGPEHQKADVLDNVIFLMRK